MNLARLQEEALEAWRIPNWSLTSRPPLLPNPKMSLSAYTPTQSPQNTKHFLTPTSSANSSNSVIKSYNESFRPTKIISAAERASKIAKGLCYYCDQPYERGHKHQNKRTQLFLVEVPRISGDERVDIEEVGLEEDMIRFEMLETDPCISLHVVNGVQTYQTMRVTGHYGRKPIQILIDSGSTHNFLDVELAKKLGCRLEPILL